MKTSVDAEYLEELEKKAKRHDFFEGYIKGIEVAFAFAEELVKDIGNLKTENCSEKPNNCTNCECTDDCAECKEAEHGCKDEPQRTCDNCGTPRDKCVYCIEEDKMWTPKTEPQTERKE